MRDRKSSHYVRQLLRDSAKSRANWISLERVALTEIPEALFDLHHLEHIQLADNKLHTLPAALWKLPKLRTVIVVGNPIEILPDRPGLVIDAETYYRCHTQVSNANLAEIVLRPNADETTVGNLIEALQRTAEIQALMIGTWSIIIGGLREKPSKAVIDFMSALGGIECLQRLSKLSIRGMHLPDLPPGIGRLRALEDLDASGLNLQSLPGFLSELPLQRIYAMDNQLTDIPESFRNLSALRYLSLPRNGFKSVPSCIFDMSGLESLDLSGGKIATIPADILRLKKLKAVSFHNNPIESPPPEVTTRGLNAIRDYWRQRESKGVDYLCEAKLVILGEPGAGKTSLARKIKNPAYKLRARQKSTEGIDVIRYGFPTAIRPAETASDKILRRKFQVNIWDFGGQEIYHATHQFFLTRRSVYVLVCDDRKEDTDFSYWLHVVEMLSDASPLLIVQNEKQDRARDINLSALRARFPNLRLALATNLDTNRGLDEVINTIRKELEGLPHVGIGLPATWKRVREALEEDKRNYLPLETYLAMCESHGFERRDDKLQLSGYLHDLGICLHFQDDPVLKNTVILKPSWGTDAVYRVLDDAGVIANRGQFTKRDLARIWSDEKYDGMQDELLQLMMKFQLCYALAAKNRYIAPQLLSSEQPRYAWDTTDGLVLRYEYRFMPKGILTRFVVATHHLISDGLVWRTGVVLEREGSRAEVIEDYAHRQIRVRVSGANTRGLLAIVDNELARLHASFPRLQYDRLLPCPCSECREMAEPFGFPLKMLERMTGKSQPIQCHVSGEMIDAAMLVRDVLPHVLQLQEKNSLGEVRAVTAPTGLEPEVFVSYAWTDDSCPIVDRLQQAMAEQGIRVLRDREEIRYKDSIRDFMKRLGRGKAVIVVISDTYLKSEYCMYELVQVAKAESLRERIFPILLPDANLKAAGRARYVKHWEAEVKVLDDALKEVRGDNLHALQSDLNDYAEIRRMFDGLAGVLRDMNAMTPDWHAGKGFDDFVKRVRGALGAT